MAFSFWCSICCKVLYEEHILLYILVLVYHSDSYQEEGSSGEQAMEISPFFPPSLAIGFVSRKHTYL